MSKKHTKTETPAAQPEKAPTRYIIAPPKRPLTGTKFGQGNEAAHHALAEAALKNGGALTQAQAVAVLQPLGHARFWGYAVRRLRVAIPLVDAPQQDAAA